MRGVNARAKALVVPLENHPEVQVAGATELAPVVTTSVFEEPATSVFEPLADAAPTTIASAPSTTQPAGVVVESFEVPPASSATSAPTASTTTILEVPARPEPTTSTSVPLSLVDQALERVSFDWRTHFPDWQVEFLSARDGIRALTFPAERRIEVFVRSTDTATTLHRVFAHELGHVIDVELNSDEDRARWSDARDIDQRTPWWPSAESPDFDTGAGDFAEAFAVWETAVSTRSTVGGQPDADDLALLRELAAG
jgi:hypothetical protein